MRGSFNEDSSSEEEWKDDSGYKPFIVQKEPSKAGRKPTEPKWTRVIKIKPYIVEEAQIFSIIKD